MIDESSGISLNIAAFPVHKKKKKEEKTVFEPAVKPQRKPKLPVKKSDPLKLRTPAEVVKHEPSGILKKPNPPSSIWKKFKKSHKKGATGGAIKPDAKPEKSVKKSVKVIDKPQIVQPSKGVVSFDDDDENVHVEPKSSTKKVKYQSDSNKGSFKFLDSDDVNAKPVVNSYQKKSKTGIFSNENELSSSEAFADDVKPNLKPGKTTSLFYNNPEIPNVPHKAVRPVKEPVFSNLSFEDLNLHPYMVKYLKESMGLTKMTKVQEKSIPVILNKQDVLVKSQTGSGKTLAFALPILHKLQEIRPKISRSDGVLVLVVVPTRELALQTYEVFNKLVKSYTWIVPGYLAGGEKRKSEKARLRKGISILIGTPGRLLDHIQHTKALTLDKVSWLVIDEADRLLDMGYERDVSILLENLNGDDSSLLKPSYLSSDEKPKEKKIKIRQTVLLSATLTQKVEKLAGLSLKNPVFVDACEDNVVTSGQVPIFSGDNDKELDTMVLPESLVQKYVVTPPKLKLVTLASFLLWKSKLTEQKKILLFIATQDMVDYHAELLSSIFSTSEDDDDDDSTGFSNSGIELFKLHGNMKQKERTEVFKTFRKSHLGVLLCTDVASRGLDLPEVDWVIQYTGPTSVSDYVHRVGRTARGGQSGSSIIFLTPNEVSFIGKLESCQIRLQEEKMETCLNHLLSVNPRAGSVQEEATNLQSTLENLVAKNTKLYDLACKAFASWSRFYASYPRNMRDAFSVKSIHQGHYAKSFALRDSPSVILNYAKKKNLNEARFPRKRPREEKRSEGPGKRSGGLRGKGSFSAVSEFDSGLEPLPKKKKQNK